MTDAAARWIRIAPMAGLACCVAALAQGADRSGTRGLYFPEEPDLQYWPGHLPPAARLYQCWAARTGAHGSVMVWTNRKGQVMAVAPALEGARLAAIGVPLVDPAQGHASDPVHVAARGLAVGPGRDPILRAGHAALVCMQTSDD